MRKRSCGNRTWKQDGGGNPREFNTSICVCPTQGHSLQVTLPCSPGGLPAKEAAGLRGQPTAPPRPFPADRSPFPASGCQPEVGLKLASPTPAPNVRRLSHPNSGAPPPPPRRAPVNVPFLTQDAPFPASNARSRRGPGMPFPSSLPPPLFGCPPGAAPVPGQSPQRAAASRVLPAPPRSRADTV